jgi:hypothetical protein
MIYWLPDTPIIVSSPEKYKKFEFIVDDLYNQAS